LHGASHTTTQGSTWFSFNIQIIIQGYQRLAWSR
jgi:hypothetical protein